MTTLIPKYELPGTATNRPINLKLQEWVSPEDFGAVGDGITDDTVAVQAAFDSGKSVRFANSYAVTSVTDSGDQRVIDFNGNHLKGIATTATPCILLKKSFHCDTYDLAIDGNFNDNYACAFQWFNSATNGATQFNNIFGLFIYHARYGFVYGSKGAIPSPGAQSENAVFGFRTRGVQNPFYAKAPYGVLFFSDSIFYSGNEEWPVSPAFNWFDSRTFVNEGCLVVVNGGEIQQAASTIPPYAAEIQATRFIGTVIEVAPSILITGDETHFEECQYYNTKDNVPAFVVNSGATGSFYLTNSKFFRLAGTGSYSSSYLVDMTASGAGFMSKISGCNVLEYAWPLCSPKFGSTDYTDTWLTTTAGTTPYKLDDVQPNQLAIKGYDVLGYSISTWYSQVFGGGTNTFTIASDAAPYGNLASCFQLSAQAQIDALTVNETSPTTIKSTTLEVKPGYRFRFNAHAKVATTTNATFTIRFYDLSGTFLSDVVVVPYSNFVVGSWTNVNALFTVPANAAYMGLVVVCAQSGGTGVFNFADVSLQYAS